MLRIFFILIFFYASLNSTFSQKTKDSSKKGVCENSGSIFCCANYYGKRNATECKKCPEGFYSLEGATECSKCRDEHYGKSCVYKCNCKAGYEICHHVEGCINKKTAENKTQASTDAQTDNDDSDESQLMMFLSITVAVFSLMIVTVIVVSKGYKVYVESKTSTIKAITKKNKDEHNTRKGNEYGTYKKTVIGGNDEDEYDFDSDNFSEEEDAYASIRESQLIRPQDVDQLIPGPGTVYNVSSQYTMSPYVYNHLDHFKLPGTPIPKRSAFSRPEKYGTTLATFQEEDG